MRLFDFVEQNDAVGPSAHGLGELAAFVIAHVAGRRADEPRHRVLFHVFRHVDSDHGVLVVEQVEGEAARKLGFPTPVGPRKIKLPIGRRGVFEPRRAAKHGVGHGVDRLVLADHALMQVHGKRQHFFLFAFHELAYRNMRPSGDDRRDVLFVNLFLKKTVLPLLPLSDFSASASCFSSWGIVPCWSWAAVVRS